jgi:hypothetical protein
MAALKRVKLKWLYLSSQDIEFATDDYGGLKSILGALWQSHKYALQDKDYRKLSVIRHDVFIVFDLLATDEPEIRGTPQPNTRSAVC